MMKVVLNRWWLAGALMAVLVLSAVGFLAYRKTQRLCTEAHAVRGGANLLWDGLPGQLTSISLP